MLSADDGRDDAVLFREGVPVFDNEVDVRLTGDGSLSEGGVFTAVDPVVEVCSSLSTLDDGETSRDGTVSGVCRFCTDATTETVEAGPAEGLLRVEARRGVAG